MRQRAIKQKEKRNRKVHCLILSPTHHRPHNYLCMTRSTRRRRIRKKKKKRVTRMLCSAAMVLRLKQKSDGSAISPKTPHHLIAQTWSSHRCRALYLYTAAIESRGRQVRTKTFFFTAPAPVRHAYLSTNGRQNSVRSTKAREQRCSLTETTRVWRCCCCCLADYGCRCHPGRCRCRPTTISCSQNSVSTCKHHGSPSPPPSPPRCARSSGPWS